MWQSYLLVVLALGAEPKTEAVELKTNTGTLYGTLDLPVGAGPWPVVLLHPGSGPTDRDGNNPQMKNNSLKLVGQGLANAGIACLRIDKRGIAASAKAMGKEEELRLATYADDVTAWVSHLRGDKRFGKVGFIGHSEGSLIGCLAGKTAQFDAFVSLCGPGRKFADLLREQLARQPKQLYEKCLPIIAELESGKEVSDIPSGLKPLFRPSVQPYLISTFKPDPTKELASLSCPILVVSGSTDVQVSEEDSKLLSGCKKGVKAVRIEQMNHVLKEVQSSDAKDQLASYLNPDLPVHPKLVEELVRFLKPSLDAK